MLVFNTSEKSLAFSSAMAAWVVMEVSRCSSSTVKYPSPRLLITWATPTMRPRGVRMGWQSMDRVRYPVSLSTWALNR